MGSPGQPRTATSGRARVARWVGVLAVSASLLSAAPAVAQDAPGSGDPAQEQTPEVIEARDATLELAPEQPRSPDDLFATYTEAQQVEAEAAIVRIGATQASIEADQALLVALVSLDEATEKTQAVAKKRDGAKADLARERDRLSDLTVRAYVTGGQLSEEEYAALIEGDTSDSGAGRQVMFDQVLERQQDLTDDAKVALSKARKALVAARAVLEEARAESDRRAAISRDRAQEKDTSAAEHDAAAADTAAARRGLGSARSGPVPEAVSIIGLPRLTAEDLAGWFRSTTYRSRSATPIEDYARWFIEEGDAEGIRGDIAFAQAVLETGGFSNNDTVLANNFSGIGHCDLCPSGWRFSSPRMGVRAQIQLLKSYAVRKPVYAHPLVDKRLRGPAGCCPTWADLTTVWATDPTYSPKIMLLYGGILDHALGRRQAGQGFDDPVTIAEP